MPLTGHFSEFPMPEVLLLIGSRTGRLRMFDAEEFHPMELDLAEGRAHGLHIGDNFLTSSSQIIAELSFAVETGNGAFEFTPQPIVSVTHPLPIGELVMQLVMRVDEKQAKHRAVLGPELFYILQPQQPLADLSPELLLFLLQSRQLLASGVRSQDLAEYLGQEDESVKLQLYELHQFGYVKLVETTDVETLREMIRKKEFAQLGESFFLTREGTDLLFPSAAKVVH